MRISAGKEDGASWTYRKARLNKVDEKHRLMVKTVLDEHPELAIDESKREAMNAHFSKKQALVCPCNGRPCPCIKILAVKEGVTKKCGCGYFVHKGVADAR